MSNDKKLNEEALSEFLDNVVTPILSQEKYDSVFKELEKLEDDEISNLPFLERRAYYERLEEENEKNKKSYLKCNDCGKESEDVTLEDFYGDGFLMNLCNKCAEYRSDSL